jgi:exopolyphosphatase/pppGpp-phosphohydrolase
VPLGSGVLIRDAERDGRPSAAALATARSRADAAFAGVTPPAVQRVVVVGGSTTSLRLLSGDALDTAALGRALELLAASTVGEIADRHGLHPERVRTLPAGLVLLVAVARALGEVPLEIGRGGVREGVVLELLDHR